LCTTRMTLLSRPVKFRQFPIKTPSRTSLLILFAVFLVLRSNVVSGPAKLWSKLKFVTRKKRLAAEELAQVLEQVYVKRPDGGRTLLVPIRESYVSEVRISLSNASRSVSMKAMQKRETMFYDGVCSLHWSVIPVSPGMCSFSYLVCWRCRHFISF